MLAAGRSSRFGSNKLIHPFGGKTLIERALDACGSYRVVAVTSPELLTDVQRAGKAAVVNDEPMRGMAHSLRLANVRIDPSDAIAVLPADLSAVTRDGVSSVIERAYDVDVCYPARTHGTAGHPVVFSPRARRFIDELPDGDTIHLLRDRAELTRRIITIDEDWPYADIDVRSDLPTD